MTATPMKGMVMTVEVRSIYVLDLSEATDADLGKEFAIMVRFPSDREQKMFVVAVDRGVAAARYMLTVVGAPSRFEARGTSFTAHLPFEAGKYYIEGEPRANAPLVLHSTDGRVATVGNVQMIHPRVPCSVAATA